MENNKLTFIPEINEHCDMESTDLEDRLCEQLDAFCEWLYKDGGNTRQPDEDDDSEWADFPNAFIWKDKANKLINEEIDRLTSIAEKYYSEEDMESITIQSDWYKEL